MRRREDDLQSGELLGERGPLPLPDHLAQPVGRVAPEGRLGQLELPVQVERLQPRARLQQVARLQLPVNHLQMGGWDGIFINMCGRLRDTAMWLALMARASSLNLRKTLGTLYINNMCLVIFWLFYN